MKLIFHRILDGGPPWPVEIDWEALQQLVPDIVIKDIAEFIDGSIRHESGKVAEWLIEYMDSAIETEQT